MRILLPTMRDPGQIGGTSTHIAMLQKGLEELGHHVAALYLGATLPGPVRKAGIVWPSGALNRVRTGWGMMYSAEARGRLLAVSAGRELSRAHAAGLPWGVLNAQEVYSVPHLRSVADECGIPLVLTLHGYPLYESLSEGYSTASRMGLSYLMRAEMQALRLADAVVTVDTRLYRHVLRLVPERANSVYTLMNFIDTSAFAPGNDPAEEDSLRRELRGVWDVPEGKVVLFCPRRLVKKNGVIYPSLALAAMSPADRGRFLLLHAGEGGEREEMERIIRENHLEKEVRLLGGQGPEAVRDLYRLADIVLVPSVHSENVEEATSLSALEAMASGRPLIAGNVGGLAEMVVDGETGLLVPADAEALAAAILRLAAAPDLANRMAASARRYVVEKHSHLRAAAAYAEVYRLAALPGAEAIAAGTPLAEAQPAEFAVPPWQSLSVLGFTLDVVTLEQAAQWVLNCATSRPSSTGGTAGPGPGAASLGGNATAVTRIAVSFNPELVTRAEGDPAVAEALISADLCYPDGVGAVWAAARQGARTGAGVTAPARPPERVPGIDLAQRVLELATDHGLPVFFLGAAEGVAAEAARLQTERLPHLIVAGTHHGYFPPAQDGEVARIVRDSGARILLVAMGAPRQEVFLYRWRNELGAAVGLGVGGTFDVWAGRVKRAPAWAQKAKAEWLYRLAKDPRRVRRQLALPRYAAQVIRWSPDDYGPPRRGRGREALHNSRGTTVSGNPTVSPDPGGDS